jgi:hypothetical protein
MYINDTSSYLDLSPLYGHSLEGQMKVRRKDGTGRLHEDVFAENRLLLMPPAVSALLVMFSRNHNVSTFLAPLELMLIPISSTSQLNFSKSTRIGLSRTPRISRIYLPVIQKGLVHGGVHRKAVALGTKEIMQVEDTARNGPTSV